MFADTFFDCLLQGDKSRWSIDGKMPPNASVNVKFQQTSATKDKVCLQNSSFNLMVFNSSREYTRAEAKITISTFFLFEEFNRMSMSFTGKCLRFLLSLGTREGHDLTAIKEIPLGHLKATVCGKNSYFVGRSGGHWKGILFVIQNLFKDYPFFMTRFANTQFVNMRRK